MHNNVPSDVIVDILVQLSVKTLSRYKCVSKHFCSLISDPRFVKRHIHSATIDKDVECQRRKLVILAKKEEIEYKQGKRGKGGKRGKRRRIRKLVSSLYHVECEAMSSNNSMAVKIDCPRLTDSFSDVKFIGSFNGLLLCLLSDRFFLFNPTTKELKRIPELYDRPSMYGFGYDHLIDDYNVVQVTHRYNVYVYSLKTDTWRAAQNFPYKVNLFPDYRYTSDPGVPLNGAIHWVLDRGEDELATVPSWIVAFDLAEGKFRELPRPTDAANNATGIGVLGGCMCWLTYKIDFATEQQYFWVMKEYGVKESWAKVLVVGVPFMKLRPLSFLKGDIMLLEIDGRLVVYNDEEFTDKDVLIPGIGRRLEMETYVESLVSPNAWKWELKEMPDEIFG